MGLCGTVWGFGVVFDCMGLYGGIGGLYGVVRAVLRRMGTCGVEEVVLGRMGMCGL